MRHHAPRGEKNTDEMNAGLITNISEVKGGLMEYEKNIAEVELMI